MRRDLAELSRAISLFCLRNFLRTGYRVSHTTYLTAAVGQMKEGIECLQFSSASFDGGASFNRAMEMYTLANDVYL